MATFVRQITDTADDGSWASSSGAYRSTGNTTTTSGPAGLRFVGVPVTPGALVSSAILDVRATGAAEPFTVEVFTTDDQPPFADNGHTAPSGHPVTATPAGQDYRVDVTAAVRAIVARPGWRAGNALGFKLTATGKLSQIGTVETPPAATLTIEYEATKYLDPAGALLVPVELPGAVEVEQSITVQPFTVPVTLPGAVDVVAPRVITAEPLDVPVTLPGGASLSGTGTAPPLTVAGALVVPVTLPGVPTLQVTIAPAPPPIPWRELVVSEAFQEALDGREIEQSARVEIVAEDGTVLATLGGEAATHPGVESASVTCDSGASIRWGLSMTVTDETLFPRTPGDLLHPLAHNRARVWWRLQLPDGTWGEVPVGTYYLEVPDLDDQPDGPIVFSVTGSDAVAEIKRATWDTAVQVGGMTCSDAIAMILASQAPWAPTAITPTGHRLPTDYEPGEPGGDPWADVERIAAAAGMVAYVDRMGVVTVEPIPTGAVPVAVFTEGAGATFSDVRVGLDLDDLANKVTVVSTSPDVEPPLTAVATDDDPSSPLWIGHGHTYHKRVESGEITTQAQADDLARATLADLQQPVEQVTVTHLPRPDLDPGDTIVLERARAGVAGPRRVVSWSLDLPADGSGMQTTTTTRRRKL
ncbi:DUF5047 domain-containing protein [Georgenia sp. TF02-10]|uniref:DUF5047 domain-containing protein n=1 Tax=Georgenia sp. TF02-10 TaxID=2917725 RepID=UPI001FA7B00B|nr:DUF5047 domain-containing protein [Georgenia sp. TF02-10]UNX54075.1 DUF5047 domain-containing protein [Georgenia sp. TF02-10]